MTIFDQITGTAEQRLDHLLDYTGYVVDCLMAEREPDPFHLWLLFKKSWHGIIQTNTERPSKNSLLYFIESLPREEKYITIYGSRQAIGYFIDTVINDKRVIGDVLIQHKGRIVSLVSDESLEDDVQIDGWGEMRSDYLWVAMSDGGKYLGMSTLVKDVPNKEMAAIFSRLKTHKYIV